MNPEELKQEQTSARRKVALVLLIVLTVVLLTISIVIAIKLNQTPPTTGVAENCPLGTAYTGGCGEGTCTPSEKATYICDPNTGATNQTGCLGDGSCPVCDTTAEQCAGKSNNADLGCQGNNNGFRCKCVAVSGGSGCPDILVVNCATQDPACTASGGSSSAPSSSGGGGNCTPVVSGNRISLAAGCPSVSCTKYTGPNTSPTCNESAENFTLAGGTSATVNPACMKCQQIDCGSVGVRKNNNTACATSASSSSKSSSKSSSSISSSVSSTTSATTLPDTALFSEESDPLIFGMILIVGGLLSLKFGLIEKLNFALVDFVQNPPIELSPKRRKITRTRKSFEDKFEED